MPRRHKDAELAAADEAAVVTVPKPKAKAVTAVYAPIGNVRVNLTTPNGNDYHIVARQPFKIASEDVAWFFNEWAWAFRQRLCRAEDYHPTCGYGNPKAGTGNHPSPGEVRLVDDPKPTKKNRPPTSAVPVPEKSESTEPVTATAEPETKTKE